MMDDGMMDDGMMDDGMMDDGPTLTLFGPLGTFSGGSVSDLHAAADTACPGGATIWVQDGAGTWHAYGTAVAPSLRALVNSAFTATFADGFVAGRPVWVSECNDAMMGMN